MDNWTYNACEKIGQGHCLRLVFLRVLDAHDALIVGKQEDILIYTLEKLFSHIN